MTIYDSSDYPTLLERHSVQYALGCAIVALVMYGLSLTMHM